MIVSGAGVCFKVEKLSISIQPTFVKINSILTSVDAAKKDINKEFIITDDDFDSLYADMNPNQLIAPCVHVATKNSSGFIHGGYVPNVCSWNELYSETVPWPQRWMSESSSIHTTTGGISTASIPAAANCPIVHFKTSCSYLSGPQLNSSVDLVKENRHQNYSCQPSLSTETVVSSANMLPTNTAAMLGNDDHQNTAKETVQTNTAMLRNDDHQNRAEETDQTNTCFVMMITKTELKKQIRPTQPCLVMMITKTQLKKQFRPTQPCLVMMITKTQLKKQFRPTQPCFVMMTTKTELKKQIRPTQPCLVMMITKTQLKKQFRPTQPCFVMMTTKTELKKQIRPTQPCLVMMITKTELLKNICTQLTRYQPTMSPYLNHMFMIQRPHLVWDIMTPMH